MSSIAYQKKSMNTRFLLHFSEISVFECIIYDDQEFDIHLFKKEQIPLLLFGGLSYINDASIPHTLSCSCTDKV